MNYQQACTRRAEITEAAHNLLLHWLREPDRALEKRFAAELRTCREQVLSLDLIIAEHEARQAAALARR